MDLEKLNSMVARIFFFGALLLVAFAILEEVVNLFGYTITTQWGSTYHPGRLLQFAALLAVFVIVILLREVREELKKTKTR